jgi:DNA topoisomerase-1
MTARLRYVSHTQPGISRIRGEGGFRYQTPDGASIQSTEVLARIQKLAIPPSWSEVWICLDPRGHLQAVGRDVRGRRQYRYHVLWRKAQEATKFNQLLEFAQILPALRLRIERDLALPDLPREKVLAAVVWLLEMTLIRVGNAEYARDNQSFGLTTLQDLHSRVEGMGIRFAFRGKSAQQHMVEIEDPRLTTIIQQCQELPGQELFQYVDLAGTRHDIASEDVNDCLQETGGPHISAKDFRTWRATVFAFDFLQKRGSFSRFVRGRGIVTDCMKAVARLLGNTPAIARKSYVHPVVVESYLAGEFPERDPAFITEDGSGLSQAERATVAFLQTLHNLPQVGGT